MRITIFGGGGFIGSAVADRMLRDGHEVKIFEHPRVIPYRQFSPAEPVTWVTGDLLSADDVSKAVEGGDVIFHLVSTTLPKSSNDDPIYDVRSNLVSTLQMLNAMVLHNVARIVFISSGGTIYGNPVYLPLDEKHPTDPIVSYGITKLAIEKYLLLYAQLYGLKPVILRVANTYGERHRIETAQGAVGVFIHRALRGEPVEVWGDGSITRDFIYVGDVAQAFAKAATYSGDYRVFNIGSGNATSLNALIEMIEQVLDAPVKRDYRLARVFDVPASVLCNKLAQQELGWFPEVAMKDGIARTAEWMQQEIGR